MAKADADLSLLFGILALQNNFIGRDALLAAFNTWVADRSRTLGEILLANGALTADTRVLLEALTRKHLELHGDDAARSLEVLGSSGRLRRELDGVTHPVLTASVALLSIQPNGADAGANRPEIDPAATATPTTAYLAPAGPRFRILRPHAHGGLGTVSVARDCELSREVALKEILERHADDPDSRARFVREAEVTGGLEHPGVVPVYGLGEYADGRPFYAMRFIRGDSLKKAIARFHDDEPARRDAGERTMALRALLRRFVDVCAAIDYAHSRGVLHRDLKPGNIMLGRYGETLVVDWGLAKTIDPAPTATAMPGAPPLEQALRPTSGSGSSETMPGSAVGTPAYMSPEQAEGRADLLGPASDVYSLGATLYAILTGRPPFEGTDPGAIMRSVIRGEFTPPSRARRGVPRSLESICLKAMALEPGARYASAHALADDVERWLADEPVFAHREPPSVRLARWGRRHRPVVAGLAAALVALLGALAVGNILVGQQRDRAQRNLNEARRVVEDMYTGVSARLDERPGMDEYQREILEKALAFYERFALPQSRGPDMLKDAAGAGLRVAEIQVRLGRNGRAEAALERALALLERAVADQPADPTGRRDLAAGRKQLGNLYRKTGRTKEAELEVRRAVVILRSLPAKPLQTRAAQLELAECQRVLAHILDDTGQMPEAAAAFHDSVKIRRALVHDRPQDTPSLRALADGLSDLAGMYLDRGQVQEAEAVYRETLPIRETVAAAEPESAAVQGELGTTLYNVGLLYETIGKPQKAEEAWQRAAALYERRAADHPAVAAYQFDVASVQEPLGRVFQATGREAEAEAQFRRALAIVDRLARDAPEVLGYQEHRVRLHTDLASLFVAAGRLADGEAEFVALVAICQRLVAEHPRLLVHRQHLSAALNNLAAAYHLTGRVKEAAATYQEAARVQRGLVAEQPEVASHREGLAEGLINLGELYRVTDRAAPAESALTEARTLYATLFAEQPRRLAGRDGLARVDLILGELYRDTGRRAEADAAVRRALPLYEGLVAEQPDVTDYQGNLADAYNSLGLLAGLAGRPAEAESWLRRGRSLWLTLATGHPDQMEVAVGLARTDRCLGQLARDQGDPRSACACYTRAERALEVVLKKDPRNDPVARVAGEVLSGLGEALGDLRRDAEALADLDRAMALADAPGRLRARLLRARITARQGHYVLATDEAAAVLGESPATRDTLVAARVYALAVGAAEADSQAPAGVRHARADQYAGRAVAILESAVAAGAFEAPSTLARLELEPDLNPLRSRREFRALLGSLTFPADPFAP